VCKSVQFCITVGQLDTAVGVPVTSYRSILIGSDCFCSSLRHNGSCWKGSLYFIFGQLDNAIPVSVPVYVILGHQDEHLGLMIAMEEMKLFDKGEVTINPPNLFNNVVIIIIIIIIVLHMLRFSFPGICQAEGLL